MKVEITYPHIEKKKVRRRDIISYLRWPFVLSGFICFIVNWAVGDEWWSLIALWSLWMVWTFVVSPDLVEYNRISQWIRIVTHTSILLLLIDFIFPGGWSLKVVPIVCFSGLAVGAALLFTDLRKQIANISPMINLAIISLIGSSVGMGFASRGGEITLWPFIVLGGVALVSLVACFVALGSDFFRQLKKSFHMR